jgi:ribosomal-protein-alanine N-acetyltransferase
MTLFSYSLLAWAFPPPPIVIEPARPEDLGPLAEIHGRAFAHEWSETELAALVADPSVICLVAKRGNAFGTKRPFGFLLLRFAADEAEVLTIAVDPTRCGRGYGHMLMMAGIERLIRRDVAHLFLEVDEGNAPAVRLYQKIGFIEVGKRKGYYATANGRSTALVMRLDLK